MARENARAPCVRAVREPPGRNGRCVSTIAPTEPYWRKPATNFTAPSTALGPASLIGPFVIVFRIAVVAALDVILCDRGHRVGAPPSQRRQRRFLDWREETRKETLKRCKDTFHPMSPTPTLHTRTLYAYYTIRSLRLIQPSVNEEIRCGPSIGRENRPIEASMLRRGGGRGGIRTREGFDTLRDFQSRALGQTMRPFRASLVRRAHQRRWAVWRRGWDSNPRRLLPLTRFRDELIRPL
jgi:hypothetical protein